MKIKLFHFLIAFISLTLNAETEVERKGSIAGRYLGAVVLADEFSKTNCGRTANLVDSYKNVAKAVLEIKSKSSEVSKKELDVAFSEIEIQKQRQEMRELISTMKLEKCDEVKKVLLTFFENEARKWKSIR